MSQRLRSWVHSVSKKWAIPEKKQKTDCVENIELPGVLKKEMGRFQESVKEEVEFPGVFQEKTHV